MRIILLLTMLVLLVPFSLLAFMIKSVWIGMDGVEKALLSGILIFFAIGWSAVTLALFVA